ncbi:ribose-5-phosphate isomerase RpiA [Chitinophagaceae bacterium LB-8]|uniref:Ribose-5-phosphate isomerase A n=1 Tax=Paraflavisolibacter caeni TaxID=2982496 RepID=A0A9X2XZK2_9BACT|nr:ribose-5-phosphate isomerase RpiA [Paraflavisolibacter caeni]MCU7552150.1 ribose-5-phosphate isomerase RpiA [Paraflavisolibacter caeni]
MSSNEQAKQLVGRKAAELVKPNMTIGIGTGSTVYWFILALAEKIKNGLNCKGVPTSIATKNLMQQHKIPVSELNDVEFIDLTIDGADEITHQLQLIKGGGGALLQEKMVAANSKQFIIIADEHKYVSKLGKFPLPVEVVPYGWKQTKHKIEHLGCTKVELRERDGQIFITDHGHYILDCYFNQIEDPTSLHFQLKNIPGLVEVGLFLGMANGAFISYSNGEIRYLS